jgi:hypothetical protein
VIVLVTVGTVGVLVFQLVRGIGLTSALRPFNEHLAEYTAATEHLSGGEYIRGGIIPVNVPPPGDGEASVNRGLYERLPKELRAASPEDAGTAVWTECDYQVTTYHPIGELAGSDTHYYQCYCEVTLVDLSISKIVSSGNVFDGREAPPSLEAGKEEYGECPWEEIGDYLAALPRG